MLTCDNCGKLVGVITEMDAQAGTVSGTLTPNDKRGYHVPDPTVCPTCKGEAMKEDVTCDSCESSGLMHPHGLVEKRDDPHVLNAGGLFCSQACSDAFHLRVKPAAAA